jgi:hypothetical protein
MYYDYTETEYLDRVLVSRNDPAVSPYYTQRIEQGIERRARNTVGKRKVANEKPVAKEKENANDDDANTQPRKFRRLSWE